MISLTMLQCVEELFGLESGAFAGSNFFSFNKTTDFEAQAQTNDVFSEKWVSYNDSDEKENLYQLSRDWYLSLYGFVSEAELAAFLQRQKVIFDAGCGLGYKAAWFAKLAPESIVIGMDFSDASLCAANNYRDIPNLFFVKSDIADTHFADGAIDYVSCDQFIMHTEDPDATFRELSRITNTGGNSLVISMRRKPCPGSCSTIISAAIARSFPRKTCGQCHVN